MAYDQWKTDSGYHEPTPEEERERVDDAMTQYNADDLWEELENSPTQNIDKLSKELSDAKAEIARLTAERDEWQRQHDLKDHRCFALAQRAENAEAEIARLREALLEARTVVEDNDVLFAIDRALKPDTGEKP